MFRKYIRKERRAKPVEIGPQICNPVGVKSKFIPKEIVRFNYCVPGDAFLPNTELF